ncbi:MAG TPA: hypothetical protein VJ717_08305 [Gemmatimonadaceae bacterium]|nr:hypothetical protein [Gemmatimonadaceae bacterium]
MISSRRGLALALCATALLGCGGDPPSGPASPPTLSVTNVPATARAATAISPGILVRALSGTAVATRFGSPVTVAIDSGVGVLQGTTTVQPVLGEALFSDLRIGGVGRFVLRFSANGVPDVLSSAVVVSPDSGSRLVFRAAPSLAVLSGGTFGTQPIVEARAPNNTLLTYPVAVQATLVRGNGVLTGGTSATSSAGVATFSGLGAQGFSSAVLRFSAFGFQSVEAPTVIQIFGLYVRPRLSNNLDTITVARDTPVDVSIRFVTGPNDLIGSARFDVVWDPRLLTLMLDQAVGSASVLVNRVQVAEGVLQVTVTSSAGLTGAPDVMNLTFRTTQQSGEGPISTRILDVRAPDGRDIYRSNVSATVRVLIP